MSLTSHIFGVDRATRTHGLLGRVWQQLAIATNCPVLIAVVVLCTLGVCSIWADSPPDGKKQLVFIAVGTVCLFAFQAVNYQRIGQWSWAFYIVSILLILYTILPGVPRSGFGSVKTSRPWYRGAGKDGSQLNHAWFIGFAPANDPQVAFAIMIEYGGSGNFAAQHAPRIVEMCIERGYITSGNR